MKWLFPCRLGLRFFTGRRKWRIEPYLRGSIIGIGLSLVPLIVVLEVSDGMIEGITRRYLELGTYHLQVRLPMEAAPEEREETAALLRSAAGVRAVFRERQGMGLLYAPGSRTGATLRAVPPDLYASDEEFRRYFSLTSGSFDLARADTILLGREIARTLGVGIGDSVKILTTRPGQRYGFVPRISTAMVSGIFTTGYQELDRLWSYIPLDTGEKILAPESSEEFLGIKLHDPFTRLEVQAARLQFLLPPGDRMYTWYELELSNYRSFQTTRALLLFIMAMIVAVAAINISSSLIMVVLEKRVELGVLKSLGASPSAVSSALVFTGFLAGLAGAALGIALGLFLAVNINELIRGAEGLLNLLVRAGVALVRPLAPMESPPPIRIFNAAFYLEEIPIRVRLVEVFLSAGLTVLLATVAAWFPARGAGRIRPLEVIRRF
jgi:lipoprotein-releasing system permease protein